MSTVVNTVYKVVLKRNFSYVDSTNVTAFQETLSTSSCIKVLYLTEEFKESVNVNNRMPVLNLV